MVLRRFLGGTGKAEVLKLPGAGITPKPCPKEGPEKGTGVSSQTHRILPLKGWAALHRLFGANYWGRRETNEL